MRGTIISKRYKYFQGICIHTYKTMGKGEKERREGRKEKRGEKGRGEKGRGGREERREEEGEWREERKEEEGERREGKGRGGREERKEAIPGLCFRTCLRQVPGLFLPKHTGNLASGRLFPKKG